MDSENKVENTVADGAVNTSASEPPPERPALLDRQALRRKRIDDYRDEGLADPVAGEACLTGVIADLHGIESGFGEVINQSVAESPPTLETIGQLEPALNSFLRVTKQLDRLMHLAVKMAAARTRAHELKLQLQSLALQDPLLDVYGLYRSKF